MDQKFILLALQRSLLVQWTRSGLIFYGYFYIYGNRDRSDCSVSFGRSISDEVKLIYTDDIGVWFIGLNACNFRRILLFKYPSSFQETWNLARTLQTLILLDLSFHFIWNVVKINFCRFVDISNFISYEMKCRRILASLVFAGIKRNLIWFSISGRRTQVHRLIFKHFY